MRQPKPSGRTMVGGSMVLKWPVLTFLVVALTIQCGTVRSTSQPSDNDLVFDEASQDLTFELQSKQNAVPSSHSLDKEPLNSEDAASKEPLTESILQRFKRGIFDFWSPQEEETLPPPPAESQLGQSEGTTVSAALTSSDDTKDEDDEEDADATEPDEYEDPEHSGESPTETTISVPHYFRVFLSILEDYLEAYADHSSESFRSFAYNISRGFNLVFQSQPDRIIVIVVSIQKSSILDALKVVVNLEASNRYTNELITDELTNHIRTRRSIGGLRASEQGLVVNDFHDARPNTCNSYELPCDNAPECYRESSWCDGVPDCPDRSDELECPPREPEQTSTSSSTSSSTSTTESSTTSSTSTTESTTISSTSTSSTESSAGGSPVFAVAEGTSNLTTATRKNVCRADDEYPCKRENYTICKADKCNGIPDCPDGDDEEGCPKVCDDNEFSCDKDKCLPATVQCNRYKDCVDGTDEDGCQFPDCTAEQFKCNDGRCIDLRQKCDRNVDCLGGEDEEGCPECTASQFQCDSGDCIPYSGRCDRNVDCSDASDEYGCPTTTSTTPARVECSATEFQCDSGDCIPYTSRCDRNIDCSDASDEYGCRAPPPTTTTTRPDTTYYGDELNLKTYPEDQTVKQGGDVVFQCRDEGPARARVQWVRGQGLPMPPGTKDYNGRLEIPKIKIEHSGTYACRAVGFPPSSRSEANVYLKVIPYPEFTTPAPRFCGVNEATCQNGECIPKQSVCNGVYDCADRSDEERCSSHGCEPNEFRCNNKRCVQKTWRCDSENDCGDNSDEQNCEPSPPGSACRYDEFHCKTGDQCIPKTFHCDTQIDCQDGSDEIGCSPVSIITPPPHMTTLDVGATFTVTCRAYGIPTPEVIWRLNWGHVPAKCTMTSVNGFGTLTCPDVQEADEGAYSCEALSSRGSVFATPDAILIIKKAPPPSCPPGTFNDLANTTNDCISCFCFGATTECKSANLYVYQLPPPITLFKIVHVYFNPTVNTIEYNDKLVSPLQNYVFPLTNEDGFKVLGVLSNDTDVEKGSSAYPYFSFPESFYGNQLKSYGGYIKFAVKYEAKGPPIQAPLLIISGNGYKLYHKVPAFYPKQRREISARIFAGLWYKQLGTKTDYYDAPVYKPEVLATREEIMMTLANLDQILIQIQFVENDQIDTAISNVRVDSAGVVNTGQGQAAYVEECRCPVGYTGLSCESCSSGYSRRTEGPWLGQCYKEPRVCQPGSYGDPDRGIPCRPCPCPLTSPPNQFGRTCYLDTDNSPTCSCPPGYTGRRCEKCAYGFTGNPLLPGDYCKPAPCHPAGSVSPTPDPATGQCICKEHTTGQFCNQCKANTFYLSNDYYFGCISCFCMGTTNECHSSQWYRQQVVSTFTRNSQDFKLGERRTLNETTDAFTFNGPEREIVYSRFHSSSRGVYYWILPLKFLHDKITSYGGYLNYTLRYVPVPGGQLSRNSAADVEIISHNNIELLYYGKETIQPNTHQTLRVPLLEQYWQRPDGRIANREHFLMALADLKAILIKATYTTNTREVALQSVSLDIAEDRNTGQQRAFEVEECSCPVGYRGLSCQDCADGYTRTDQGLYLGICELCDCNGHSTECHPETGVCLNCGNNTMGDECNLCRPGYTGNPTTGEACTLIAEERCNCDPRGTVNQQCVNDQCVCKTNVIGQTCNKCRPGTFDLHESHIEGCIACYCSGVTAQCTSSNLFITQIPMQLIDQSHGFTLTDGNRQRTVKTGFIINAAENQIGYDYTVERGQRLYWSLPPEFTGNKVTSYGGNLTWTQYYVAPSSSIPHFDTDVIIFGNGISLHWTNNVPLAANSSVTQSVPLVEGDWRRLTSNGPQRATRPDIMLVLSSIEAILIKASYASQTSLTFISDVSLDTVISQSTSQGRAVHVESCRCPVGYKGFSCESCEKRYYRASQYATARAECRRCPCNGHEESCFLAPDYQIICNCQQGYSGRSCDKPELSVVEDNVTITEPPTTPSIDPSTPVIYVTISEPLIQIVAVGSAVRYKCNAESAYRRPILSVKWSKEGGQLPSDRAVDSGDGNLILYSTTLSDSGIYLCSAFDGYTYVTQRASLTVGEPTSPKVTIYPSESIEFSEGEVLEVTCEVTGIPVPDIEWGRLGPQIPGQRATPKDGKTLRIENLSRLDAGLYYCRAVNSIGSDIKVVNVRVNEVDTRFPKDETKLIVQPTEYTGNNGDTVRFECSIVSGPGVSVSWSRSGNRDLPPTAQIRNGVFVIFNAAPADSGTYICQALGENNVAIGASVSVLVNILRTSSDPPALTVQPETLTAFQGTNVTLRCACTTDPNIPVTWSKSNDRFSSSVQIKGSDLVITSIQVRDRGIYICEASNDVGTAQAIAVVDVERREPPKIEIHPKTVQTVIEGGSAVLQCRILAGYPTPRLRWFRARNQSYTPRVETLPGGVLKFSEVTIEDDGQYICSAENDVGMIEAIATIQVNSYPVVTINPTGTVEYNVGQRVRLECYATGKPAPVVGWDRYPAVPVPGSRNLDRTTPGVAVFEISHAQESDSGVYTCTATNGAGSTEDRVQLLINESEDGDSISFPHVIQPTQVVPSTLPDEEFVYPVGAEASIRCDTGSPTTYIHWTRENDRPLPDEHYIQGSVLFIRGIKRNDAGKYTCLVIDAARGTLVLTKSANIRVIDPPRLSLNPARQVVRPGDNAYVRCSAEGDQPITLSWSTQNGAPLPYSVVTDRGNLQFRGITVYDAGKYVCRGRNLGGEAEAVAEVIVTERATVARPVITARDRSQFVSEGSDLDLKCAVESPTNDYQVNWSRERNPSLPRNSRVAGDTLRLINLRPEDSDRYLCRISSPFGSSVDYIDLHVDRTCLPDEFRCSDGQCIINTYYCDGVQHCIDNSDEIDCHKYRRGTSNVSIDIETFQEDVKVGDNIVILCKVNGDPEANVSWSKFGGKVASNVITNKNQLRINDVQIANGGIYKCTASTKNGVKDENYNLGVQLLDGSQSTAAVEVKRVSYGQTADLSCNTTLDLPANYSWIIQSFDPTHRKVVNSNVVTLTNVTSGHSGLHMCVASNSKNRINLPTALVVTDVIPAFDSTSYVTLPPLVHAHLMFEIELSFKPYSNDGLLLYNAEKSHEYGDFVSFGLRDGVPEFRFDVGSGAAIIRADRPLSLNTWHTVRLIRKTKTGTMEVDNNANYTGTSSGPFSSLELKLPLYIGGAPEFDHIRNLTEISTGFNGCISYLTVDSKIINLRSQSVDSHSITSCKNCMVNPCLNDGICQEYPNKLGYSCICLPGFVGPNCKDFGEICYPDTCGKGRCISSNGNVDCLCPFGKTGKRCKKDTKIKVPSFNTNSYMAYSLPYLTNRLKIEFIFRPALGVDVRDGILLYASADNSGQSDFIAVLIVDGRLVLKLNTDQGSVKLKSTRKLIPGEYTPVVITIDERIVKLSIIDDVLISDIHDSDNDEFPYGFLKLKTPLYIGGYDKENVKLPDNLGPDIGFYGCVSELQIMDVNVNLTERFVDSVNVHDCYKTFGDLCSGNPCRNRGTCVILKDDYTCKCAEGFSGKGCDKEIDLCSVNKPCQHGGECISISKSYMCDCKNGYGGRNCDAKLSFNISFDGSGYARLASSFLTNDVNKEDISFTFSTTAPEGLLLWNGNNRSITPNEDFLAVYVENGYVTLSHSVGEKLKTIRATDHKVSDGGVHKIVIKRDDEKIWLHLDDYTLDLVELKQHLIIEDDIYIGGVPDIYQTTGTLYKYNFNGCVQSMQIDGRSINFGQEPLTIRNAAYCSA